MRGLRTRENDEFNRFFALVQEAAAKHHAVYFCDHGDGRVKRVKNLECEDLWGWRIPESIADIFETLFVQNDRKQHDYDQYYCYVDYKISGESVAIKFDYMT